MTIAAAKHFIRQALMDPDLVQRINAAADQQAIRQILTEQSLPFNYTEFDQAYTFLLCACQTREQAQDIECIKLWWDCLGDSLDTP